MKFYKMNGAGNEIAILDGRRTPLKLDAETVRRIADPQTGAKADQVIAMEPSMRGDVFMRIWNNTGDEVGACGNAARCVAWLVMEETGAEAIKIETEAGLLASQRRGAEKIAVDMGSPLLKWEEIPLAERMDTRGIDLKIGPIDNPTLSLPGAVNMGNPHCVFFVEDIDAVDVEGVGPLVEGHMLFPQRVNAGFAQILDRNRIRLRVWERDAGLTQACGSGACAAVVAAHRRGLTDREVTVVADGGELHIHWRESDDRVVMTGPIEMEFEGEI